MPKRDIETFRNLLLRAEATELHPNDEFNTGYVDFLNEITPEEGYQLTLMRDAGLVEGREANLGLFRITHEGHDFLDAIRNEKVWSRTKSRLAEVGGDATVDVIKTVATNVVLGLLKFGGGS